MSASGLRSVPNPLTRVLLALALPVFFTACPTSESVFSSGGVATNGHLSGATVTCDANKNTVLTDANGAYNFPTGCPGSVTVSGGTNVDTGETFAGELKAPAGASAVNSLTTLMVVGGLTEAELKASLGLPSSVNLLATDPAAESGANYANSELFAKAKTVQQLFQTSMDTLSTTASVTDADAKKAIYSTVASALASQIKATPTTKLVSGSTVAGSAVSEDLVKSMLSSAVTQLKASSDSKLASVKTGLNTVQPATMAALMAPSLATQSQQYMANVPTTVAAGQAMAALIQKDQTLASQISNNASFLSATDPTKVADLTTAMKTLVTAANNPALSNDDRQTAQDTALTTLTSAQTKSATNTGIAAPAAPNNYLAINKDAVALKSGGPTSKIAIADFAGSGATLKWPLADNTQLGVSLLGMGSPNVSAIEVAVDISQPSKSGAFKAYISGMVASMTSSGLRIQSTANTKMIAWARNDAGSQEIYSDLSAEVANIDTTLSTSANQITFMPLNSALERAIVVTGDTKGVIKKLSGTFNVTMVVKGLPLRMSNQTPFKEYSISVPKSLTSSSAQSLTGPGLLGKVILAP
ncbi:MAG: hypothetical protein EBQ82_12130 [Betaproteobacteria bacterium]|nr:hypothetical protein [Betaproteobacteria bacterium]